MVHSGGYAQIDLFSWPHVVRMTVFLTAMRLILCLFLGAAPVWAQGVDPSAGKSLDRLRMGVVLAGDPQMRQRVEPFRLALENAVDLPVDLFLFGTLGESVLALADGRIDYVRLSASGFAAADRICECVEPVAAARPNAIVTRFHAVMIARGKAGDVSLDALEGRRLAVGPETSLTGFRVPLANLAADGLNPHTHFSALVRVSDPVEGVRAVLDGRVQAALGWSTLAGDAESGYTAGTLRDYFLAGGPKFRDLAIVWRSAGIPYNAHTVRSDLPAEIIAGLRSGLLELRDEDPAAYLAIEPDLEGGLEAVTKSDYRAVLRIYDPAHTRMLDLESGLGALRR